MSPRTNRLLPSSRLLLPGLALLQPAAAQAPSQFELQAPAAIFGLSLFRSTTADVDGDGDLDVLGTARVAIYDAVHLLRNDGNGHFTNVTTQQMPGFLQRVFDVAPFDCDGDGDVDLYLSGDQTSLLLRNNGAGTFAIAATMPSLTATQVVPDDLDGDGDVDLVLATQSVIGGVDTVLVNNGSGSFAQGPVFGFGGFAGGGVVLFDIDGDGDRDLYYVGAGRLLRNDGALQFTDVSAARLAVPTSLLVSGGAAGDIDGDGDIDCIASSGADVVLRNQAGVIGVGVTLPTATRTFSMVLSDLDRDGDLDLVRAHQSTQLTILLNDGAGNFASGAARLPSLPIWSSHVHAADLDGDADPDVLTSYGTPALLLRNRHVHLDVGPALRGQNWNVELWSKPGYAIADGVGVLAASLARLPAPLPLPPFGNLWLDLNGALLVADSIPMAAGRRAFAFAIPSATQLVGVQLNVQGLVAAVSGALQLTALGITTIQ